MKFDSLSRIKKKVIFILYWKPIWKVCFISETFWLWQWEISTCEAVTSENKRVTWNESPICDGLNQWVGWAIWREDFLIWNCCYSKGWHLLILFSAPFLLTSQQKVNLILGTRRKKRNWGELGRKGMVTKQNKTNFCWWLGKQHYQAHQSGANFVYGKSQIWAQMPLLLVHRQILNQNLAQREKNKPNKYM